MAFSRTIAQLITSCRARADKKVGEDGQLDAATWQELLSEHYGELHGAVAETGARYFETEATITPTGAASYALPADHLSTVGVDRVTDSAGSRVALDQLMVQENSMFGGRTGDGYLFALTGATIALYPTPASGTYKHIYVPQPTDYSLASTATAVDLINNDGWKFVVWGVASVALHVGDTNQQRALMERDQAKARLIDWAVSRALTMPKRRMVGDTDPGFISPADWRFR